MLNGLHRRLTYLSRPPLLTLGTPRGPSPLRPTNERLGALPHVAQPLGSRWLVEASAPHRGQDHLNSWPEEAESWPWKASAARGNN